MPSKVALFLLILWLALPAAAEPFEIAVKSYPPGALLRDQFGNELGWSGGRIVIDWDRSKGSLQLEFSKAGHQRVVKTVTMRELQKPTYPQSGEVALPPETFLVGLKDVLLYRTWRVLFTLLFIGGTLFWLKRGPRSPALELEHIGDYRLEKKLGQGGMAEVFLSHREELPVALKLMHQLGPQAQEKERLRREIQLNHELAHPNLAQLYDWGEHQGRLYMVSEYLEGQTLREKLTESPRLSPAEVKSVLKQLGSVLGYLHGRNVIHRDLKPSNIFLTHDGRLKLLDLGIARVAELTPLTQTGSAPGTPHYMAPEQIRGRSLPQSDQYALGVLTFELIEGERPFSGQDRQQLLEQHLNQPMPELKVGNEVLQDTLRKLLDKKPENRFETVEVAVAALIRVLEDDAGDETRA